MTCISAVGVNDDLSSCKSTVSVRSADHETSGRVDEEFGICIYHLLRKDLIEYIFFDILMDLLLSHILIMLCGENDCIEAERLSVLIVLNSNLGLSIRS